MSKKGYEKKGDRHITRFLRCPTGHESLINLIDCLERPWYLARYWFQIRYYANHVTVSYGKIRRK